MISAAVKTAAASPADPQRAIAELMGGVSLEATRPTDGDIAALVVNAPAGTRVYLSAIPTRPPHEVIRIAARLHAAGFEPVPHLAARSFASVGALDDFLARAGDEACVRRVLVIAGDRSEPTGPFRSAVEAIDSGVLQRRGICEIGIAGYPEGHPRIAAGELEQALLDKIQITEQVGLSVHVVTQFAFDAAPIISWIERLRDFGIECPVRIGLAGPATVSRLLRFAARCGVQASAQGLARQAGLMRQVFGLSAPDGLVRALAEARQAGRLGQAKLHFFSFGGLAATGRWTSAVAAGRISLAPGGFQVAPPGGSR
jgi:methylenetetrahydrofolate reductase (NADPH)